MMVVYSFSSACGKKWNAGRTQFSVQIEKQNVRLDIRFQVRLLSVSLTSDECINALWSRKWYSLKTSVWVKKDTYVMWQCFLQGHTPGTQEYDVSPVICASFPPISMLLTRKLHTPLSPKLRSCYMSTFVLPFYMTVSQDLLILVEYKDGSESCFQMSII